MTGDVRGDLSAGRPSRPDSAPPVAASHRAQLPDPTPVSFAQFVDDAWLYWSVQEVDARAVPGALGARCLVFTRADCIRRVWDYPPDWRTRDATELAALSWRR